MKDLSRRLADLSEEKQSLLQRVLRREGHDASLLPIRPRGAQMKDLPLSHGQESLWFMCHLAAEGSVYNLPSAVRLRGRLDRGALERALAEIVRRHEILRTRFPAAGGRPAQEILDELPIDLLPVDLSGVPEGEREARARELALAEALRPFDLAAGPLLRISLYALGAEDHILVFVFHHLIWDGWSIGVMTRELAVLYQAFSEGRRSPLPELPIQYADFALWQRAELSGDALEAEIAVWRARLAGLSDTALPTDRPRPAVPSFSGAALGIALPAPLSEAIEALGARVGATPFMTLLAAFQILLGRYAGADRVAVGTPVANRRRSEVEGLIGHFANLLVMTADLSGGITFTELVEQVKEAATDAYARMDIPFELLVDRLQPERDAAKNPLFQVLFAVHMDRLEGTLEIPGLTASPFPVSTESSHFDAGVHLWRSKEGFNGYVSYNSDLFLPATIERLVGHYRTLLEAAVLHPDRPIAALPMLTGEERRRLMDLARGATNGPAPPRLLARIAARAAADPDRAAIVHGAHRLTYAALMARAGGLAAELCALAPAAIGVCAAPGIERAIGVLGALNAGIPLVSLDPALPPARIAAILEDAGAKLVLVDEVAASRIAALGIELLRIDSPRAPAPAALPEPPPDAVAYLSCAAADPVTVTHRALDRRIARLAERLAPDPGEAMLLHPRSLLDREDKREESQGDGEAGRRENKNLPASPSPCDSLSLSLSHSPQDAGERFVLELLWPLSAGATIVLADEGPLVAPDAASIRWIHCTPDGLAVFLATAPSESLARLSGLRGVIAAGTLLRTEIVEAFHRRLTARLYHLYSPPEAAADVGIALCAPGAQPAGKPELLPVYLLDRDRRLVPVGVPGTVYVADPEDPDALAGPERARLTRTADRGVWLPDGALRLIGAEGRSVFRKGLRVHLEEIEAALLRHPAVDACHVMVRERESEQEILAYVVPARPFAAGPLAEHLRATLPPAALPSDIVPVTALPRGADGQVDARALAAIEVIDAALCARWQERIEAAAGGAPARVIAVEPIEPEALYHISDLLPDYRPARAAEQTSTESASARESLLAAAPRQLAIAYGGPLEIPADAPATLGAALARTAAAYPDHGVRVVRADGSNTFLSYPELFHAARRVLSGLRAQGLGPGDQVILQIEELEDYFPALWACILGGIAPVTVSTTAAYDRKSAVLGKLYNTWELLRRPAIDVGRDSAFAGPSIVASDTLAAPLAGVAALYRSDGVGFRILPIGALVDHTPAERLHEARPDDLAFVQLTSGSTGVPKCIQETHRATIHHILGVRQMHGFGPGQVHMNWLPMDHSVPILLCHIKDTYLGIQGIHAKPEVVLGDPLAWLDIMERYRVTHTWSPNFGYKLVNDALAKAPDRRWDLSSFEYTMNGAEQVTVSVAEEFMRRLAPFGVRPGAMVPAFGMGELATGITYQKDWGAGVRGDRVLKSSLTRVLEEAQGPDDDAILFVCVGKPLPGVEIRIVDADNRVLPERVIGVLQIRSPCVTAGYLHNEEANREVFVGDGWFSSGDLGFIKDGSLTITGRQKEMIVVRGANYYCYELEDAVGALEGVAPTFVAACAVDDPSSGTDGLAIFFVPKAPGIDPALIGAIREKVTADFGLTPLHVIPLAEGSFPKTTSGKVQRTQLKKDLVAGRFQEIQKRVDLALGKDNVIPAWFYRPVWARAEIAPREGAPRRGNALVYLDEDGLGASVADRLGDAAVRVERGSAFARLGPRHYALTPGEAGHHEALFAALSEDGVRVDRVLHFRTYGPPGAEIAGADEIERAQRDGALDLLGLVQALARDGEAARPLDLLVISSHTQARGPQDRIACERAPVRGLVKAISHEWPHIACRHVDLPHGEAANVDRVIAEMDGVTKDWEVLHRGGARWVRRLDKATLAPGGTKNPVKRGDLVLITGGLGGVGVEIARCLLEHYDARLVLVGRTPLDEDDKEESQGDGEAGRRENKNLPASPSPCESLSVRQVHDVLAVQRTAAERRAALSDLQRAGGEVIYEVADAADLPALRDIVARAEQRFQARLAGVVHLAGAFPTRLLAEETPEGLLETLRPKLAGARALGALLGGEGYFIGFDTVYSHFGGLAVGAYAAANAALQAFLAEERRRRGAPRRCFAWSHWDELGMSRGYGLREQSIAQGYSMIPPRQGIASLLAALASGEDELVIGLDGRRPNVRRHLVAKAAPVQRLAGYVAAGGAAPVEEVRDRFGTRSVCEIVKLAELPLDATGALDRGRLPGLSYGGRGFVSGAGGAPSAERTPPRSDLERTIAAAWRDVLGIEAVDVNTSFFSLGGQSILLIQLLGKLKRSLGRELSVIDLFRYPTISTLAAHLGRTEPAKPSFARAAERAQKQREALRPRAAPRGRAGERTRK